ncbi:hypothetical protein TWF103_008880 [Orbilia oligospora]|nr:hypothetical protein TWF103_008880 [Orbilia oligospora]
MAAYCGNSELTDDNATLSEEEEEKMAKVEDNELPFRPSSDDEVGSTDEGPKARRRLDQKNPLHPGKVAGLAFKGIGRGATMDSRF